MSVVCWGGDGDRACAPDVGVTQLVGQLLQFVSVKVVIIPEDVVVAGPGGALDTWRMIDNISIGEMIVIIFYLDESRDRSQTPWGE